MANTTVSQLQFENTGELLDIKPLVDYIYPVGAIYFSSSLVNPALLFGGTWEQIKDAFLLCAGDTYAAGTTGGSATMAHTHSQVAVTSGGPSNNTSGGPSNNTSGGPSNNTTAGPSNNTSGGTAISIAQMPSHSHDFWLETPFWGISTNYGISNAGTAYPTRPGFNKGSDWQGGQSVGIAATGGGGGHTHTLSSHTHGMQSHTHGLSSHTHTLSSHTHSISATTTGGASNTNNMPPYVTIYAWKRTA